MRTCASCGASMPARFAFCGACGEALTPTPGRSPLPASGRRVASVLFCDLVGSTALGERLDAEAVRGIQRNYFEAARAALVEHGGTVEKYVGDAVLAVFGAPVVHEDDALRSVRAALAIQAAVAGLAEQVARRWGTSLAVRIGIATGEVVMADPRHPETFVTGDTVNLAARLERAAHPGQIIINQAAKALTDSVVEVQRLPPFRARGKAQPVTAFRVTGYRSSSAAGAILRPIRGRVRELQLLSGALETARSERRAIAVSVVGPPGAGKSRLILEFATSVPKDVRVLKGRALPYGRGITYWPVAEIVRSGAGIDDGDTIEGALAKLHQCFAGDVDADALTTRIGVGIGLTSGRFLAEEIRWSVRRFFEALAQRSPLVLVFDDLHWAEVALVDLIKHVVEWTRDAPILVVCARRPEANLPIEREPTLAAGSIVILDPLDDAAIRHIVEDRAGERADDAVAAVIVARAAGNPLFAEELAATALERGPSAIGFPLSLQALLSARIDALSPRDRKVLRKGAVIGEDFELSALEYLRPGVVGTNLPVRINVLVAHEFLSLGSPAHDKTYRFRHLLIRDAAYEQLLRADRARLHERVAGWLVRRAGERLGEVDGLVGFHLEQAHSHRVAVAGSDAKTRMLARSAGRHLAAAGRRALDVFDMSAAIGLLQRAEALLVPAEPVRPAVLEALADALNGAGQLDEATIVGTAALAEATAREDRGRATAARLLLAEIGRLRPGGNWASSAREEAVAAITQLDGTDDHAGLARAWSLLATVETVDGRMLDGVAAAGLAVEHGQRAGIDQSWSMKLTALLPFFGPTHASRTIELCEGILERNGHVRLVRSSCLMALAGSHAMRGRFVRARGLIDETIILNTDMGRPFGLAGAARFGAFVESLAGDHVEAARRLRPGIALMERLGEQYWRSLLAAMLAEACYRIGDLDAAFDASAIAAETDGEDDAETRVRWRIARGLVEAARRDDLSGETLLRDAVMIAEGTDVLNDQGDANLALAAVLASRGRGSEAVSIAVLARERYRRKGNIVGFRQASAQVSAK